MSWCLQYRRGPRGQLAAKQWAVLVELPGVASGPALMLLLSSLSVAEVLLLYAALMAGMYLLSIRFT